MHKILSYVFPGRYNLQHPVEKAFSKITCYHYYFFAWLFLIKIPLFWRVLSLIFQTPPIDYVCIGNYVTTAAPGGAESFGVPINTCPCSNPFFDDTVFTKTYKTKFNLICDKEWFVTLIQSVLYLGTLIGSFVFGFLSDRIGRLNTLMITCVILCVFGIINAFINNLYAFLIIRCIEGFGLGGSIVTSFVLCVEYCGANNRELIVALYHVPINVGHMTLAGVSFFIRDCDHLQLALTIPLFAFLLMWFLTTESPKWLLDKNRVNDAVKVMDRIGRFNRKPYENIKSEMEMYQYVKQSKGEHRLNFCTLFRYRHLVRNFFCMAANYFGCGAGYYGVSQYIGRMSGNIHKNVAISGGMIIPGTIMATFFLKRFGRRPFLMSTNILAGSCIMTCIFLPSSMNMVRVLVACLGNTFFFMSFITVFLYGVELFPTSIRNAVLGVLCVLSRFGQIVAPMINRASYYVSGMTFAVIAIVAGILCLPLPETKGTELPTTLEDIRTKDGRAAAGSSSSKKDSKKKSPQKKDAASGSWFGSSSPPKKSPQKKDAASGSWFGSSSPPKKSPQKKDAASGSWFGSSSPAKKKGDTSGSWFGGASSSSTKKKGDTSGSWFGSGSSSPKKK